MKGLDWQQEAECPEGDFDLIHCMESLLVVVCISVMTVFDVNTYHLRADACQWYDQLQLDEDHQAQLAHMPYHRH